MEGFVAGDIGATKGKGIAGWLSKNLFIPHSDRFHFFLIAEPVDGEDDYIILESITSKGITVGRLSWYPLDELHVYRVKDPHWQALGRLAVLELTKYGRAGYDYLLPVKLLLGVLQLILKGKLPPWRPEQLPYGRNSRFLCTEAANESWRAVGYPIIPEGVCPLPAGFELALEEDRLVRIGGGN